VLDPALDIRDGVSGVAFVPLAIEVLGRQAELDDEVAGEVPPARPPLASPSTGGSEPFRLGR
jgi:hypothetical protein